jgi:ribosomal protein S18 acetylase RimI-like enzyme
MITINNLAAIAFDDLYSTFHEAFKDYNRTWSKDEFGRMLHRRGYNPRISFGAFEGDQLVSFTLNGFGRFNNKLTAYDTGSGTIKEYRGKGLATEIFKQSIPHLKKNGVQQYLLEVIHDNKQAVSLYTKLGFKTSREFNYFIKDKTESNIPKQSLPDGYEFKLIDLSTKEEMRSMWDFNPSWQNDFQAVEKNVSEFKIVGIFKNNDLIGYGIVEPASGDIPQIAVTRNERRKKIGTAILGELITHIEAATIRVINTENGSHGMTKFIESNGIPLTGSQFEMILPFS